MRRVYVLLVFIWATASPIVAQIQLGESTTINFATIEQGKRILGSRDDFVQRMSPFDRSARMKTENSVAEAEYLEFVKDNVLAWSEEEKKTVASALDGLIAKLTRFPLPLPKQVVFIKTTGTEEGGAAYTRANAIIFPQAHLSAPKAQTEKTICHELFHILSRENPELRERLYGAIGFEKCDELELPKDLKVRRLTNPDAPKNDHCIRIQVAKEPHWAIPIILSNQEKYDPARGGEFFDYLLFQILLVHRTDHSSAVTPMYEGETIKLFRLQQITGFFEQVGQNTGYIIHPEEILADNFVHLVLGSENLPTPAIVKKLETIINEEKVADPAQQ